MEGILQSMANLKFQERNLEPWRQLATRAVLSGEAATAAPATLRVAIVSVCDYDAGQTPLARLSQINKEEYARRHGYDVIVYEKAPVFQDPLTELFTEPASYRPAAWSKVDAILTTLASSRHDWVLWMDCDSFFMDSEVPLSSIASFATAQSGCPEGTEVDDLIELRRLVNRWMEGPEDISSAREGGLLQWYDELFADHYSRLRHACNEHDIGSFSASNQTLGWTEWLFREKRPQLIASEDGLMLNTGVMLI